MIKKCAMDFIYPGEHLRTSIKLEVRFCCYLVRRRITIITQEFLHKRSSILPRKELAKQSPFLRENFPAVHEHCSIGEGSWI